MKTKISKFFVIITIFFANVFFEQQLKAETLTIKCMGSDLFIDNKARRVGERIAALGTTKPSSTYYYSYRNSGPDEIIYETILFRAKEHPNQIWRFVINLENFNRSFTARYIPDEDIKELKELSDKAEFSNLGESKKEKTEYTNQIDLLKKNLFDKHFIDPKEWDGEVMILAGNDYELLKEGISYQVKFTFPCSVKN